MAMDASRVSEEGPAPRKKNSPAPQRAKTATAAAKKATAGAKKKTSQKPAKKVQAAAAAAAPGYSVVRVITAAPSGRPVHYWLVSLKRQGKEIIRQFFDIAYGGEEYARLMAFAYRDAAMRLFPPWTLRELNDKPRRNNKSGIPGVYPRVKSGIRVGWLATLDTLTERHRKYFTIREHGDERAKELATAAREEMLTKYANRFATWNAEATASAQQLFGDLLLNPAEAQQDSEQDPLQDQPQQQHQHHHQQQPSGAIDEATFQRRHELLNAWFDSFKPQHIHVRVVVYRIARTNGNGLFLTVGSAGPGAPRKHKVWSLQPRNYEACLPLVWDVVKDSLIARTGVESWLRFEQQYQDKFFASTEEEGFYTRHRTDSLAGKHMHLVPPEELLPMLDGIVIPVLETTND